MNILSGPTYSPRAKIIPTSIKARIPPNMVPRYHDHSRKADLGLPRGVEKDGVEHCDAWFWTLSHVNRWKAANICYGVGDHSCLLSSIMLML